MSTIRDRVDKPPRTFRAVELPGGLAVYVRDLTLAELRDLDRRAEAIDAPDRNTRYTVLLCAAALAEADGSAVFPELLPADIETIEGLTLDQIEALARAALPSKDDAKNA